MLGVWYTSVNRGETTSLGSPGLWTRIDWDGGRNCGAACVCCGAWENTHQTASPKSAEVELASYLVGCEGAAVVVTKCSFVLDVKLTGKGEKTCESPHAFISQNVLNN